MKNFQKCSVSKPKTAVTAETGILSFSLRNPFQTCQIWDTLYWKSITANILFHLIKNLRLIEIRPKLNHRFEIPNTSVIWREILENTYKYRNDLPFKYHLCDFRNAIYKSSVGNKNRIIQSLSGSCLQTITFYRKKFRTRDIFADSACNYLRGVFINIRMQSFVGCN